MHRLGVALATALYLTGTADAEFRASEPVTTRSSPYEVEGVALGSNIKSLSVYREYTCVPSEQFSGLTWCQKLVREKDRRGSFEITSSILHRRDGTVVYVNRNQQPAFLDPHEADRIVEKHSRTFAESAQVTRMPRQSKTSDAILATWGKVELQPLDSEGIRRLAEGKSPRKGLLLDFIGNFTRSAKEGLPIYRIVGGAGFAWAGSFDRKGRGTVRFLAVDASATEPESVATRSASALPDLPHDEPPRSESTVESAGGITARRDAEEAVARLQSELAAVLQDKQNAELARTRAEKKAQQAMTDAEIARRNLEEATARNRAAAARDQIDLGGGSSRRSVANSLVIIGIAGTVILLLLSWILSKISSAPTEEAAAGESDADRSIRAQDADETARQVMPSAAEAKIDIDQDDLINELAETLGLDPMPGEALADAGRDDRAASQQRHTVLMSGDERPRSDGSDEPISTDPPEGDRETLQTVVLRILHHSATGTVATQPRS
jgi:hypothetical protein